MMSLCPDDVNKSGLYAYPALRLLDQGDTSDHYSDPVDHWHEIIGDPTIADVILDRVVHNAHKINLKGESKRKEKAKDLQLVQ